MSGPAVHLRRDHRRQRHHLVLVVARVQARQVLRVLPVWRVGLDDHPPHVREQVVLADRQRPELRLDRAVHVLDRNAEQLRLLAVDVGAQLLRRRGVGGREPGQLRPLARLLEEVLQHALERDRVAGAGVLDPELEAAGGADAGDRRRRDRDRRSRPRSCAPWRRSPRGSRARSRCFVVVDVLVALVEVGERDEDRAGVGLEAAVEQAVARHHRARRDARQVLEDLVRAVRRSPACATGSPPAA